MHGRVGAGPTCVCGGPAWLMLGCVHPGDGPPSPEPHRGPAQAGDGCPREGSEGIAAEQWGLCIGVAAGRAALPHRMGRALRLHSWPGTSVFHARSPQVTGRSLRPDSSPPPRLLASLSFPAGGTDLSLPGGRATSIPIRRHPRGLGRTEPGCSRRLGMRRAGARRRLRRSTFCPKDEDPWLHLMLILTPRTRLFRVAKTNLKPCSPSP